MQVAESNLRCRQSCTSHFALVVMSIGSLFGYCLTRSFARYKLHSKMNDTVPRFLIESNHDFPISHLIGSQQVAASIPIPSISGFELLYGSNLHTDSRLNKMAPSEVS